MKKIFYFIASAIVALGAVACQNDIEENIENNQQTEGLSFTATIDDITRVVVEKSDIAEYDKKLSWEGNETIVVSDSDFTYSFEFKNTKATPNIFTCTEKDVNVLVGKTVSLQHGDDSSATFYDAHAEGSANSMYLTSDKNIENFATEQMGEIKMCVGQQLFRLECYEEVTLKMYTEWNDLGSIFFYDWKNGGDPKEEVVFAAGEHYFTANAAYDVTIEAYINGVKVKETSGKDLHNTSVIYNLGTIAVPNVLYLNPGIWNIEGAWFAAYFFNSEPAAVAAMTRAEAEENGKWVKMTDEDADGIYECEAPAGYNSVIFTRMDPAKEELSFDSAKNQTADLAVPAADAANNTYAVTGWDNQEENKPTVGNWGSNPVDAQWGLIGIAGNWETDVVMESVAHGVFAAKSVKIAESDTFKVRKDKAWDESYGAGEVNTIEPGHFVASFLGGYENNFKVSKAGTYDVYFAYATKRVYVVTPGADYTTAKEQNANPSTETVPGQPSEWALVGAFSGWADRSFVTTTTSNIVVLEGVTMKAAEGFLVRKPSTDWADKYGAGSINYLKANHFITTSKEGADMCLEKDGTYDIYFDASTKKIYIMTAGTDYKNATEQKVNGEEPKQEEPEVTEKVIYLKPNSNWTQSNARFAAYFWNNSGNAWVSMVDSDKDGIYEVNLPKGYDYGCSVIFCRMNPSTTANNWNNKWNQTSDLKVPTDGKNLYTVKDGTWDKGGGSWSVK